MVDIWTLLLLVLLLVLGLIVLVAGLRLATGNRPWSHDPVEPSWMPTGAAVEGVKVAGSDTSSGASVEDEPTGESGG